MKKSIMFYLCLFLGIGLTYASSYEDEFQSCVDATACGVNVMVCGDTLEEMNEQHGEWEQILGCGGDSSIDPAP
ncbi:hypothetical protein KIH41_08505 [Litoribacter ruber]|uniref:Secreted protein n=1 Tax=Litoribacter ruber TaxID=702568 RepID=A0AAP2CLL5_9BACT|nr:MULTISPECIES: hypothetical protein [Litoribacter]MBS9524097.1 hypothetical protein [Litoribacter alkaliphilus]MBT0811319.1 hypothetical protein [Litoribacter ruber]